MFGVEEFDGVDDGNVKQKKRERRNCGSSGSAKSDSKKLRKTVLEDQKFPVEDGSTAALSTESNADSAIAAISEVTREATNTSVPSNHEISDVNTNALETRENKKNAAPSDTKAQKGKPWKQRSRPAKVSHHFAKRREGKSVASNLSGRKNPQQSKSANTDKCSKADNAKSKEACEATIKARCHRKRVRRRERLRATKAQEHAAKDGRSQATDSNATRRDKQSLADTDMPDFRAPMICKA